MRSFSVTLIIACIVIWAGISSDLQLTKMDQAAVRILSFLTRMFPPDWSVLPILVNGLQETLRIAILGTFGSVILSEYWEYSPRKD